MISNLINDKIQSVYQDFVEEVIEESEVIEVDEINPESLRTAFSHLDENGFRYQEAYIVINESEYERIHGVPVEEYKILPENTAIIIHKDAIAPSPPEMIKPGVIVYSKGIVTIKEDET